MKGTKKGIVFSRAVAALVFSLISIVSVGRVAAERSVLIFPSTPAVFRYDPGRYQLLAPGDPRFDSRFAIGGTMLWDHVDARVPIEIYRAPALAGFEVSRSGVNEFATLRVAFDVIVDGNSEQPRHLANTYIRFIPIPNTSSAQVEVNGFAVADLTCPIASIDVSVPTGEGSYIAAVSHSIVWSGTVGLRVLVFSDKNYNRVFDAEGPLYMIVAEDAQVPVREKTWGGIKALYR